MIGKLLLTLLVIVLALVYLRKRYLTDRQNTRQHSPGTMPVRAADRGELERFLDRARNKPVQDSPASSAALPKVKLILWTMAGIILVAGGIGGYLHWQDQQRLVTVLLHRDASQAPVIYRVAKRNLSDSSFVTEDGTRVLVSASERMEVVGL